jgi:hypothetical protein
VAPVYRTVFGLTKSVQTPLSSVVIVVGPIFLFAGVLAWRRRRGVAPLALLPHAWLLFTYLYVGVVVNAMDLGENHRFREEVNPLLFVMWVTLAQTLAAKLWRRPAIRAPAGGAA